MPKINLKSLWNSISSFIKKIFAVIMLPLKNGNIKNFFSSWWKIITVILAAIFILYYGLGGWMVSKIDTTTDYEISTNENQSATIEMMAFLVNREVRENMWTANLPFIFPSYFLDNMPNFQLGLMSALKNTSSALAARIDKSIGTKEEKPLKAAAEFLSYPGTIWMFSPQNKLVPVPSAGSQYRKARKQLINYNQALGEGRETFYKTPQDLAFILRRISSDLWKSSSILENHILEHSSEWIDNQSDNLFYFQQGKIYAYALLLRTLSYDYKDIIVNKDVYRSWTGMIKALEEGAILSPTVIRNGELNSTTAPNSLAAINYYTVKAAAIGKNIVQKLQHTQTTSPAQGN